MTEQEEFTPSDPARRLRRVRETLRAETAKLPRVDNHGRPIKPPPAPGAAPTPESAEPIRRVPAPNPAQGSSASGPPDRPDDLDQARKRGDWKAVLRLENQKIRAGQTERAPWDTVTPA
jgi:hypothetical protein